MGIAWSRDNRHWGFAAASSDAFGLELCESLSTWYLGTRTYLSLKPFVFNYNLEQKKRCWLLERMKIPSIKTKSTIHSLRQTTLVFYGTTLLNYLDVLCL